MNYVFAFILSLVIFAILLNAAAYSRTNKSKQNSLDVTEPIVRKGILLSIIAGVLMSFFYRFIAASMDIENFQSPAVGKMTPYTAVFIFSVGIFISNFICRVFL